MHVWEKSLFPWGCPTAAPFYHLALEHLAQLSEGLSEAGLTRLAVYDMALNSSGVILGSETPQEEGFSGILGGAFPRLS